jgi:hypothetical protein
VLPNQSIRGGFRVRRVGECQREVVRDAVAEQAAMLVFLNVDDVDFGLPAIAVLLETDACWTDLDEQVDGVRRRLIDQRSPRAFTAKRRVEQLQTTPEYHPFEPAVSLEAQREVALAVADIDVRAIHLDANLAKLPVLGLIGGNGRGYRLRAVI